MTANISCPMVASKGVALAVIREQSRTGVGNPGLSQRFRTIGNLGYSNCEWVMGGTHLPPPHWFGAAEPTSQHL